MIDISKYSLIQLECPYFSLDRPMTKKYFLPMLNLKKRGYELHYKAGTLPFCTSDFISCHFILVEHVDGQDIVRMSYRISGHDTFKYFKETFPMSAIVQATKSKDHIECVENFIQESIQMGKDTYYGGSYTMDPDIKDRNIRDWLNVMCTYTLMKYFQSKNTRRYLGIGVTASAYHFFIKRGYRLFQDKNGRDLPSIELPTFSYVDSHIMRSSDYIDNSEDFRRTDEEFHSLWDNRVIEGEFDLQILKDAA